MAAPVTGSPSAFRVFVSFLLSPGALLKAHASHLSPTASLAVPGAAFTLLFLQTGLDRSDVGTAGDGRVAVLCLLGLVYGTVGVAAAAALAGAVLQAAGVRPPEGSVTAAVALSYCPSLVYVVLGALANVAFGWHTAVAFGVTGVVWAVGPMMGALRELTGGRAVLGLVTATAVGTSVLVGWALLGAV